MVLIRGERGTPHMDACSTFVGKNERHYIM